jgi:hypothetical protein
MAATLRDHGYTSCKADPDVWMRAKTKTDGFQCWSYIFVYTDDILVVYHKPKSVMDYLASRYTLKPGSVKEPINILGDKFQSFISTALKILRSPVGHCHWRSMCDRP